MIDYLYYRFYRLWLHSSVSEGATFLAMLLFSVMLSTNVLTAWGILTQYGIIDYPSDTQYYIIEGSLIALLCGRFFFKKRYRRIITKYEDENSVQRKVGVWGTYCIYSGNLYLLFHRGIAQTRKNIIYH